MMHCQFPRGQLLSRGRRAIEPLDPEVPLERAAGVWLTGDGAVNVGGGRMAHCPGIIVVSITAGRAVRAPVLGVDLAIILGNWGPCV